MTPRTDPHVAELEQQIAVTREALGQTVEELAAKADVPARAKAKARDTADRLRAVEERTRAKAEQAAAGLRSRLPGGSSSPKGADAGPPAGAHRVDVVTTETDRTATGPVSRDRALALTAAGVSVAAAAALVWAHHADRS